MTILIERGMMPGVQTATPRGFPRWWTITGYVLLAGAALFAGRIIYEETILTWNNGPQMVGFALAHGALPVVSIAGLIALPCGAIWVIGSLILLLRRRFRAMLIDWLPVIFLPVLAALLSIPYAMWEELTVAAAGPGPYGKEFMIEAAAQGKQSFLTYLLDQGYDVNYEDSGGTTALSGAAVEGRVETVRLLVAKGADVNRKDHLAGETPLIGAAEMGKLEAAKALLESGADPCATDNEGHNAAGRAKEYRHPEVAEYLTSRFHCQEKAAEPCVNTSVSVCVHP
jgi:ankyrin repeat protein